MSPCSRRVGPGWKCCSRRAVLRGAGVSLLGIATGQGRTRAVERDAVDVAIVGAGIAGLAAAEALGGAGLAVVVLEARRRIGGRAVTDSADLGAAFDRGAAWLHSADVNPMTPIVAASGARIVPDDGDARIFKGRRELGRSAWAAVEAAGKRLEHRATVLVENAVDVPMSAVARSATLAERLAAASVGPWEAGVSLATLSARSWLEQIDTGDERLVASGLGTAITRLFADVPVRLATPVRGVSWRMPGRVVLTTDRGDVRARACLITVSTGVLATGSIVFDPPLPEEKHAAIAGLPMELLDKIALRFAPGALPSVQGTWLFHEAADGRLSDVLLCPFGSDLALMFVGAAEARRLERLPIGAVVDRALAPLTEAFGASLRHALVAATMTRWGRDPWAHGSYSAALPGRAGARSALALPVGDRLFFAGEATGGAWATQAAGAWLSGRRAALEIEESLGVR